MTLAQADVGGDAIAAAPDPAVVHLVDAQRLLGLFTQGLAGRYLHLKPVERLSGHFRPNTTTTDGISIYLPESVAVFGLRQHNFGVYRIAVLHQLGFFENGTFEFRMDEARARIPDLPAERTGPQGAPGLERFFGLWESPALARRLFMTLEDLRIDRAMLRRYPGARADLDRVMCRALDDRPDADGFGRFGRLLECLVRHTLGASRDALPDRDCVGPLEAMLAAVARVETAGASVYDSAAAAAACYRILDAIGLPRLPAPLSDRAARERAQGRSAAGPAAPSGESEGEGDDDAGPPDEDAMDAMGVGFRGDVRADLVQRQLRASGMVGTIDGSPDEAGPTPQPPAGVRPPALPDPDGVVLRRAFGETQQHARSYLYDEWDFHHQTYLKGWCRLYEYRLEGDDHAFIGEVRARHADLARQVRRHFLGIRPESYQRVRRVSEGPELELDGVIDAVIDRRTGHATDERVYTRREKALREVAAAFLLDMSASTDFRIPDPDAPPPPPPAPEPEHDDDIPLLYSMSPIPPDDEPEGPHRCVIDIAKESLALMCEALETLGDQYAVYGFSGYGRDQVEFHVAKAFEDRLSARTWSAIASMKPQRSTRMGPAIRHAASRLERQAARLKVLIVVSDGFPEDRDYGPDRNDNEYGIQDTAMALREAERLGILTFCVTIDRAGHDYLRRMCRDDRYLVIDEVTALPRELAKVYRALTF